MFEKWQLCYFGERIYISEIPLENKIKAKLLAFPKSGPKRNVKMNDPMVGLLHYSDTMQKY